MVRLAATNISSIVISGEGGGKHYLQKDPQILVHNNTSILAMPLNVQFLGTSG